MGFIEGAKVCLKWDFLPALPSLILMGIYKWKHLCWLRPIPPLAMFSMVLEEVLQYKVYNESIFLFEEKRAAFCCKRLQKGGPSGDLWGDLNGSNKQAQWIQQWGSDRIPMAASADHRWKMLFLMEAKKRCFGDYIVSGMCIHIYIYIYIHIVS